MDQQNLSMLPGLQMAELQIVQAYIDPMTAQQKKMFLALYQSKRKDPQTMLILTAIGFLGFAGIHRFVVGEIGMGILYFLTWGLCGIGTIIDLVNNQKITGDYNAKVAMECSAMVNMLQQQSGYKSPEIIR